MSQFFYLNWTEATKIEWKLWKWHRHFETISSLKHMLLTFLKLFFTMHFNGKIENGTKNKNLEFSHQTV
jgi:hypothetical protein